MKLSEISPFVRYARYIRLDKGGEFNEWVGLDARLFYVTGGFGKIKTGKKIYDMKPFSLLIINGGTPYHILSPERTFSCIALNFDYSKGASDKKLPVPPVPTDRFDERMLVEFNTFDDSAELSEVLYLSEISQLCERLTLIVDEFEKKLLHFEVKCANLLSECILDAIRLLNTAGSRDNRDQSIEILDYIRENFNKPLTNKELGERFGYHPNYLNRLIKDATGMSLHGYVISVRMLHAIKLLENTTLSIGEIAEECGFCDLAYFSQYFKKYFGKNPTEYRKS